MKERGRIGRTGIFSTGLLVAFSVCPPPVFALQMHGGPEGLYVHQGAHLFLIVSLIIFLINIRRSRLDLDSAWRLIFGGAFLLVLWNIWAFIGHVTEASMPESLLVVLPDRSIPSLAVQSWREVAYYILKMDHLLCLPALMLFCAGLKKLRSGFRESGIPEKRGRS